MNCKNKLILVNGIRYAESKTPAYDKCRFAVTVTNDEHGKTLSISDGDRQFTIPFEPLEKYLK